MDGRYAPSPSGDLHLGNLRTALVAWLQAQAASSRFLVRVEDLDRGRSREAFVASQLGDLAALGLDHDGAVIRQSERTARYAECIDGLAADGLLYECFCTRAEIRQAASAPHGAGPEGAYPGTCRDLGAAARAAHLAAGRTPSLRVRAEAAVVTVRDALAGEVTAVVDDFVVRRADGGHAYNLAVVVDDADQGVEEVVRGDDLLETTPRQVWLARRLGLTPPASYVHVPLVVGDDGERLAKRHGAVTMRDLAARGHGPGDVLAVLAGSLGLSSLPRPLSAPALLDGWDLGRLPTAPVRLAVG
ncbi:tRNA glutamyl-Q(34) synthetase GluQRS [Paraconexibacter antarcticus]|uniref:Glutamyl-Q tRNA(Asp) synthetase n=1 Tax=Paraconexibacter antarcticus TaxID=2949664 RepID=A0ABY5DLZ6_9ACTN|nr:tRNA glutamyl-Q(34) synthetase GluQRS [Paraconexibacter antarcticus]UTI62546.1 tRNA glutamyl-Q(34) synthetase GluQRS [Paraconexibacter antarcticus]